MHDASNPHDREYAAAAAGLHEQTPSPRPCDLPAIGDRITWKVTNGYLSGRVIDYLRGKILVETDDDICEVDTGTVMPF
jgi:hypothetical protein